MNLLLLLLLCVLVRGNSATWQQDEEQYDGYNEYAGEGDMLEFRDKKSFGATRFKPFKGFKGKGELPKTN